MQYLLTIDAGTTSIKVGIFQTNGDLKTISTQEYTLLTPSSTKVELPVDVYWFACKNGIADVLKSSKINPEAIVALSISSQGETLVPIDKEEGALRNAIVWLDTRAKTEASEISKLFPIDKFYHTTSLPDINPIWPVAKILWIKKNEPDV